MLIEFLAWDSKFFGFTIGKYVKDTFTGSDETIFLDEYGRGKFDCVYVFSDPSDDTTKDVASRNNFTFIDKRLIYTLSRKNWNSKSERNRPYHILDTANARQIASVRQIAEVLPKTSRFWLDSRLQRKVPDMYKLWLNQMIQEPSNAVVVVPSHETNDIGAFVGCSLKQRVGDLELVAVDKHVWGMGFGMTAVQGAITFLFEHGAEEVIVKTQASNKAACGLYRKAGFVLKESKTIHHVWRRS